MVARSDTCVVKRSLPPRRHHQEQTSWTVSNPGSSRCPSPAAVVADTLTVAALAPRSLSLPSRCQAMEEAGKSLNTGHVLLLEALPLSVPTGTVSGGQDTGERLRTVLGRTREWKLWLLQNIRISSLPSMHESRGGPKPGEQEAPELDLQQNWKTLILRGHPHASSRAWGSRSLVSISSPGNPNAPRASEPLLSRPRRSWSVPQDDGVGWISGMLSGGRCTEPRCRGRSPEARADGVRVTSAGTSAHPGDRCRSPRGRHPEDCVSPVDKVTNDDWFKVTHCQARCFVITLLILLVQALGCNYTDDQDESFDQWPLSYFTSRKWQHGAFQLFGCLWGERVALWPASTQPGSVKRFFVFLILTQDTFSIDF